MTIHELLCVLDAIGGGEVALSAMGDSIKASLMVVDGEHADTVCCRDATAHSVKEALNALIESITGQQAG